MILVDSKKKAKRIYILIIGLVCALGIAALVVSYIHSHRELHFSEEFMAEFDLSKFNTQEVIERAESSDRYEVGLRYDVNGDLYLWSLHLADKNGCVFLGWFWLFPDAEEHKQSFRLDWHRCLHSKDEVEELPYKKGKYQCTADISTAVLESMYVTLCGDDLDECVRRIEEILMRAYTDLVL